MDRQYQIRYLTFRLRYLMFGFDRVSRAGERLTAALRMAEGIEGILSVFALAPRRRRERHAVRHDFRLDDILTLPPSAGNPLLIPELVARRLYIVRKGRFNPKPPL